MTDREPDTLIPIVVATLRDLARSGATPSQAVVRMRTEAGDGVELVYERDPAANASHFDAIIELPDGAVTIRYCPDRGAPFALRGAERLSDRDLVRVDGEVLPVSQAIALLDFIWCERPVMRRLLDVCIIQAALRAKPAELTDDGVQAALDRIRLANGLHDAGETLRWMTERGMTHEMLEAYAEDQAAILALRHRLVGGRIAPHFAMHRAEYDLATFARITFPDDVVHRELIERGLAARTDLATLIGLASSTGSLATQDPPAIVRARRRELSGAQREVVFETAANQLRVIREPQRLTVVQVFARHAAELDDATADLIADELFAEWLAQRRGAARIEWNWGTAERTALGNQ